MEKKRRWTEAEDAVLFHYVKEHGERDWNAIAKATGLDRCGKSCRLRWLDHLKPNLKKGPITPQEEHLIFQLQAKMGNKWAKIATHLPGRSDNEIKNFWNCKMKKSPRARVPLHPAPAPALDPPSMAKLQTYQCSQDQFWVPDLSSQMNYVSSDSNLLRHFPLPEILTDHFDLGTIRTEVQSCTEIIQRMGICMPDSVRSLVYSAPAPVQVTAPATLMPSISSDPPLELDDINLSMDLDELMALLDSAPAPAAAPEPIPAPATVPVVAPVISPESPLELEPPSELELNMEFDIDETMAFLDSLRDDTIQELPSVQY